MLILEMPWESCGDLSLSELALDPPPYSLEAPLFAPSSALSILDMPKAHLSNMGLEPRLLLGLGNGCDPVMKMTSFLGVCVPPLP